MKSETINYALVALSVAGILGICVYMFGISYQRANASAGELQAQVATSGPMAVAPTATAVLATSTCAARIITTQATGIRLTFTDKTGVHASGSVGEWQAASTTKEYDGAVYGCDAVWVHSSGAQTLWITETR